MLGPSAPPTGETGFGSSPPWRTPTAALAGALLDTLFTRDGRPAVMGRRAYRRGPDGRTHIQSVSLNQQVMMPAPSPGSNGAGRPPMGSDRRLSPAAERSWPTPCATERSNDITATPSAATLSRYAAGLIARVRKTRAPTLTTAARLAGQGNWRTPIAADLRNTDSSTQLCLSTQVKQPVDWPTPSSQMTAGETGGAGGLVNRQGAPPRPGDKLYRADSGRALQTALTTAVKAWPTPTCQDGRNQAGPAQFRRNSLPLNAAAAVPTAGAGPPDPASPSTTGRHPGQLNPAWVQALMGFPEGWLDLGG